MKRVSIKLMMIAMLATGLSFTACTNNKTDKTGKEYTSAYICPMHCPGSGSNEAGACSVCEMPMVKNKNYKSPEGNDH